MDFEKELKVARTNIPGLIVFDLPVHGDNRGWFKENWQRAKMTALGLPDFGPVQNNISFNAKKGVTRGIHAEPWDKYISIATGAVFGAFLSGVFYRLSGGKILCAVLGEVFGTGVIGALASYPVMTYIVGREGLTWAFYIPSFIGGTLIGMHLKKVAVPVRLKQNRIGQAIVLAARTRPKFIGGERAQYCDFLK